MREFSRRPAAYFRLVSPVVRSVVRPVVSAVVLTIALFLPVTAAGQLSQNGGTTSAQSLLMTMAENTRKLTYSGTFVYSQGKMLETIKIFHAFDGAKQRERLVHLTGEPREIVRDGDKVLCLHPKHGLVGYDSSIPAGPFARDYLARLRTVNEPYTVSVTGKSRVAGREVVILSVKPRDQYRYGFHLALDESSNLLLQSLMVDGSNRVLERIEYTDITIGEPLDEKELSFSSSHRKDDYAIVDMTASVPGTKAGQAGDTQNGQAGWQLDWLPAGFSMAFGKSGGTNERLQNSMMYSDGLSAFSVFVSPKTVMQDMFMQNGATLAYTMSKADEQGRYSVTVVGEIPRITAEKIADSVRR